jgi:phage gp36-like protein
MAYCSTTAIMTNLPLLPNTLTADGYSITVATIELHIRRTDGLVNGKCARRYAVPFTTTPPFIRTIAEDITSYYTYRSFFTQDNQNRSEYLEELKEEALKNLDEIMSGDIDLVDTAGSSIPERETQAVDQISSNTEDYQSFFDIDDPTDWDFDEDRKTAVSDDRD